MAELGHGKPMAAVRDREEALAMVVGDEVMDGEMREVVVLGVT